MRFYGIQPSEAAAISAPDRAAMLHHAETIRAQEALAFQATVGALLGSPEDRRASQQALARAAWGHDPERYAQLLEMITRRS